MTAVALPEIDEDVVDRLEPLYDLILLDDDDHTYDYVVEMLVKIFEISEAAAFRHAVEVDTEGRTRLLTASFEEVQAKRRQVHGYGADWRLERSQGPMSAIIEPAGPCKPS
jgi:ATP-dependent Clp protease adaptor protein ClpS